MQYIFYFILFFFFAAPGPSKDRGVCRSFKRGKTEFTEHTPVTVSKKSHQSLKKSLRKTRFVHIYRKIIQFETKKN